MNQQDIKDLGVLEGRLKGIDSKLDDMNKMLIGNGQSGLLERQARVESNLEDVTDNLQEFSELCHATGKKVDSCDKHQSDKTLHTAKGLLMNVSVITLFLLIVVSLIVIVPSELSLWDILRGWLRF